MIVPVFVPLIAQVAVAPLVYASNVPVGGASLHAIVRFGAAANSALAAGCTVIVLDLLIVLLKASVKVQLSVYVPPHLL